MRVSIPWNSLHPQFQVRATYPGGEITTTADDSHREVDLPLPAEVEEDDVEVTGCSCGRDGQLVGEAVLIKAAVEKPKPRPKLAPKAARKAAPVEVEPVVEPAAEPVVEPAAEPAAEGVPVEQP